MTRQGISKLFHIQASLSAPHKNHRDSIRTEENVSEITLSSDKNESTSMKAGTQLSSSTVNKKSSRSTAPSKLRANVTSSYQQDNHAGYSTSVISSIKSSHARSEHSGRSRLRLPKTISSRLPLLNIGCARDERHYVESLNYSPRSNYTMRTEPCTPPSQNNKKDDFFLGGNDSPVIKVSPNSSLRPPSLHSAISFNQSFSSSFGNRDEEKKMRRTHNLKLTAVAEKEYWKAHLKNVKKNGSESVRAAKGLCNLGNALLACKDYKEALSVYKKATRILGKKHGDKSLSVACMLDKVGLAASMLPSNENLDCAIIALHEALIIRHVHLGPHHCDVVDTLNKIAGIHLQKRDFEKARDAYIEVLTVRQAIFGKNHPSVAVTAKTLGKVYSSLSEFGLALDYMGMALKLFREEPMLLKDKHPLVMKLRRNISTTQRLMISF